LVDHIRYSRKSCVRVLLRLHIGRCQRPSTPCSPTATI
jgi:hypothetical protein